MSSNERRRVVITGLGAVSALGLDLETTWQGLVEGRNGVGPITLFDASTFDTTLAAEVKGFDSSRYVPPRMARALHRGIHLTLAAAQMAWDDASLFMERLLPERVGVYMGTSGSFPSVDTIAYRHCFSRDGKMDMARFAARGTMDPMEFFFNVYNLASCAVAIVLGARGPNISVNTACAASTQAIGDAYHAIRRGDADVIVAGGGDALIDLVGLSSFVLLGALSPNADPDRASRPFDAQRDGFVLGEGAGAAILESLEHAQSRGARIRAELAGYGSSTNAYRITDSPPDGYGEVLCMNKALADAGLQPHDIDYINAHGTSTMQNDRIETLAIRKSFGEHADRLALSSNKSMFGHTIAAAGALELIATVRTVETGIIPPTIHYEYRDSTCDLDYVPNRARQATVRAAISNSFGFGGQNGALVVKRWVA